MQRNVHGSVPYFYFRIIRGFFTASSYLFSATTNDNADGIDPCTEPLGLSQIDQKTF